MGVLAIDKCDAVGCGFLCLRACPLGVLMAVPEGEPGGPPASYSVEPAFERSCNACGACIEVCPEKAIRFAG